MLERRPVGEPKPAGPVHEHPARSVLGDGHAEVRLAREAIPARPARGNEAEGDVIARRNVGDAVADRLDDACALVTEHHRPAVRPELAVGVADVGMTDAGGRHAHQHLLRPWADRARPPRSRPAGSGGEGRRRGSASADPVLLERVEVGDDPETRARRRARSSRPRRSRASPAAASRGARPTTRADRTAPRRYGQLENASAAWRFASKPVAVRPGVRGPGATLALARARRSARQPPMPADEDDVGLDDVDTAAQRRGRAPRLPSAPSHRRRCGARALRQSSRTRRGRRCGAAPRASRRPSRSSSRANSIAVATSQRGARSPGMRHPWFASTMISRSKPTASRTASITGRSTRQSVEWRRSLTARTPCVAQRQAARERARRRTRARRSTRRRGGDRCRPPSSLPERLVERSADEIPDGDLDRPVAAAGGSRRSRRSRGRSRCAADRPRREALERLAVGKAVAARVALDAVVGADEDDRRVLMRARHGVPGGRERRIERIAVRRVSIAVIRTQSPP